MTTYIGPNAFISGNAEIYGNAVIYGNAKISGNAEIYGEAKIYGNAKVSGNAFISGNAEIYGNTEISGNAKISGNAVICGNAIIQATADYITIGPAISSGRFTTAHVDSKIGVRVNTGCFSGSVDEFIAAIQETHANNPRELKQYLGFVACIKAHFDIS
jgi:UDP-3-O-[3-hydroxymyristoyl] glucosamine N-acyltransferase